MSLETDLILDRRRLKRHLALWRVLAVLALVGCALIAVRAGSGGASVAAGPSVARLTVSGIITDDATRLRRVNGLAGDTSIKALLLDVDSPGGSVSGGESLHDAIVRVAARKPVVVVMHGTAASAAYMISVPAQRIFASRATLTGSIGVILQTGEVSGLLNKLGITADALVSGPLKDQPSPFAPMSDRGRQVLQGLVMDLYEQFVSIVAAGRHMTVDQVHALADGRAYTGQQAVKLGLVDAIGDELAARAWLAKQDGVSASLPVRDIGKRTWLERLTDDDSGDSLGGLTQGLSKILFGQGVTLDGAWAIWHP